jgi:peptidoglycan/xylan/chitin deacetylase (PgdA/CDA1 family)
MKSRSWLTLMTLVFVPVCANAEDVPPAHIALIFDDGPIPEHTEKLLALFAQRQVHVTFGSVAKNVESHPAAARAVVAAGHEIVNHSYSHLHPKDLGEATLEHEIVGAQKLIAARAGFTPRWYWPPFLESDDRVRATAAKVQIEVYVPRNLVSSADYKTDAGADEIKRRATANIVDGTVIVFHEWRKETLEQMPAILAELKRQRCVFLTFSELAAYVRSRK